MSNQRFIVLAFVIGAILLGLVFRYAAETIMVGVGMPDIMIGGVVSAAVLVGVIGGFISFFVLMRNARAVGFTNEVIAELAAVTWPDREETTRSTLVVVVSSVIFALFLAFSDLVWARLTNYFLFSSG